MKFLSVEIEGLQSFRERRRIELAGVGLGVATGENGVGKSTFITDSLALGLYGKARTSSLEEVISTDSLFAQVVIEYEVNGHTFKVERTIPRVGAQEVRVYAKDGTEESGWRSITERGVRESTAFIVNQLGMDYETATTTWLALQGEYGKFSKAKPAERYATLSGIFGLEQYGPLHEAAKSKYNSADAGLVAANARVEELERTLATKPDLTAGEYGHLDDEQLKQLGADEQRKAEELGRQIAEITVGDPGKIRDELTNALSRARSHRQQLLSQAQSQVSNLRSQIARVTQTKTAAEAAITKIVSAEWEVGDFAARKTALGERLEAIQSAGIAHDQAAAAFTATGAALASEGPSQDEKKKVANEKLAGLRKNSQGHSAECFTCGQHLSEAEASRLIEEQLAEISAADQRIVEIRNLMAAAQEDARKSKAAADAARNEWRSVDADLKGLITREANLRALLDTKVGHEAALSEADADLDNLRMAAAAAQEELEIHQSPTADEEKIARDLVAAEANAAQEAANVAERRNALSIQQGVHAGKVRSVDQELYKREAVRAREAETMSRLEAILDERSVASKDRKKYGLLTKAFSPAGIPAMILSGVVEEIGAEVNLALDTLSGGKLSVDIRSSKETRSGGIQQKIVIYVEAPDGTRAYETLSGGQRFRVDLAIRVGLNKVISRRTGTPMLTFIIDEGWGTLDEAGILSAVDTMERLSQDLSVLTVSHIESVKASFPTVFEVTMEGGTSVVKTLTQ